MDRLATAATGACVYYRSCEEMLSEAERAALLPALDAGERSRMARFRFPRDADLYLRAHALVREVLARYAGCEPAALRFEARPQGRPELVAPPAALSPRLRFNLSHTRGMVACAVAVERDVGVDVECRDREVDMTALASRVFSSAEREALESLPDPARRVRFFELWTLKEAYLKAVGKGLSLPLRDITASPHAGGQDSATLSLAGIDDDPSRYRLRLRACGASHQLAVVVAAAPGAPIHFEAV